MRFLICALLYCLFLAPATIAQPIKAWQKTPKRKVTPPSPSISGGIGNNYHLGMFGQIHGAPHHSFNHATLTGGLGLFGPGFSRPDMLMRHDPLVFDPLWELRERRRSPDPWYPLGPFEDPDFFPFLFPEQQLMRLAFGPPVVRSPTDLLLRQMIAPPDFGMMGLTNDAFLFSHALRGQMIGIPGAAGLPYMDLGMPFSFGTMSPFGGGSPVDRLLSGGMRPGRAVPQFNPYYPSPLLPQAGRYSIGMTGGRGFNPFNLGAPMMPGIPGLRGGGLIQPWNAPYLPARRRIVSIGQAPQPAPKPVAVKSLTDAERKVLQAFANDLAGVVEAARKKEWPKLDSAINKITALRDLPDVLGADLKELAAAATEIAVGQSVIDVLKLGANMEREYARKNPEGLARHGIATRSNALIAPLIADHIDCRAFDLQVTAADVEGVQKLVARIAEGAPAKKENNASAAAVEELLGRPLTGVETLLWLHMRADHRSAQDIAAELRKSR